MYGSPALKLDKHSWPASRFARQQNQSHLSSAQVLEQRAAFLTEVILDNQLITL